MNFNAIIQRIKEILIKPRETWAEIKEETTTVSDIFKEYVMVVAALPVIAGFLGKWILGTSIPFWGHYRTPFLRGLSGAIVQYVLTLVGVFVAAKVVEMLAPSFQAKKDSVAAFKVVAYSMTAAWVIGIVTIIPDLSPLTILGLYSFYLLYLGLPHLMECPPEKALGYTIVTIVVLIVVWIVIGIISAAFLGIPKGAMP